MTAALAMADTDAYGRKVQPVYDALASGNFKVVMHHAANQACMQITMILP